MDMLELIKKRRAVRAFSSEDLEQSAIEKILEAGQFAPSPLNAQPWQFILIQNRKRLEQLASTAPHAHFISQAALLIVVTVAQNEQAEDWLVQQKQYLYSGAAAMENMWLAAWSLNIGCCWATLDEEVTRNLISIPNEHALIGSLALGHIDSHSKLHESRDRKPLALMTSFEQFGCFEHCGTQSCFTCLNLVPKSAARSFEGEQYIKYFCGEDCYVKWQEQTKKWLNNKKE